MEEDMRVQNFNFQVLSKNTKSAKVGSPNLEKFKSKVENWTPISQVFYWGGGQFRCKTTASSEKSFESDNQKHKVKDYLVEFS